MGWGGGILKEHWRDYLYRFQERFKKSLDTNFVTLHAVRLH